MIGEGITIQVPLPRRERQRLARTIDTIVEELEWALAEADALVAGVLIEVVLDYFLLVKVFNPAGGYYKLDVYLYYALTFILPPLVGWRKKSSYQQNI